MRDKKSLFEQVAAIIFGLSLIAGAGFLFFAVCTHAYSGPIASYRVNTSAYIGMGLAVPLLGFILFTVASYGFRGAAEYFAILIGGLLGAAFRLVLAVALFASPIMAFICVMRGNYASAAVWFVSGIVLYFVGQAFKTVPTAEELQQKELERERRRIEYEAQVEKWREDDYKKRMVKAGLMCPYCYSENVIQLGTTRKPYSVGRALVFGMLSGSAALGALCGFKNPGKNKMICRSCHREFTVKPK
ncbi:zn finger protein [Collinsella sp. CAG:289]|nr:zn finger protein [Collinsella sp. CAG:289]